jgi:hypothetical protein
MFDALVSCLSNLINEQCTFLIETPWIEVFHNRAAKNGNCIMLVHIDKTKPQFQFDLDLGLV